MYIYYMSTEIYLKSKLSNKNGLSKTRSNLIGHTIFLTSEKYRMTNHRPHTKFFTSEKTVSGFPAFRRSLHSECSQLSLPLNHGFKVCRHCFSQTIYRRPSKRKHKKENSTECCFAEGISEAEERVKTYRRNSPKGTQNAYIGEFIITVRKKDNNEDYEPSSLRSLMASFERYLKKKNYGFSIMKDAEFEQARKALQSKQKDLKQKGKGW